MLFAIGANVPVVGYMQGYPKLGGEPGDFEFMGGEWVRKDCRCLLSACIWESPSAEKARYECY